MAFNLGRGRWRQLDRLLNMQYRPAEIASEIGVSADSFHRTFIPAGAPVSKDEHGTTWINGKAFRDWAREHFAVRPKDNQMAADEIYCMKCRARVKPAQIETVPHPNTPRLLIIRGRCPTCGRKVVRYKAGAR